MKKTLLFLFTLTLIRGAFAQQRPEISDYINQYNQVAIEEMVRVGIPASITLAQGILESGSGKSTLATEGNNHFGIKCKEDWTGKTMKVDDDAPQECFRVYENARESYKDHSDFLVNRQRYAALFKLQVTDYKGWAYGLKECGYATAPKYATMLLGYIEDYQLAQYDKIGLALINQKERNLAKYDNGNDNVEFQETVMNAITESTAGTREPLPSPPAKGTGDGNKREEFDVNGIRAIKAIGNEDAFSVAYTYNINYDHLLIYNDLENGGRFKDGQYIFLQWKKNHCPDATYTVGNGESMWDISQKLGIKLKELYSKNLMTPNEQPYPGELLYLQTHRPAAPKTMTYSEFLAAKNMEKLKQGTVKPVTPSANTTTATVANNTVSPATITSSVILPPVSGYQVQQKDTLYSIAQKFNTTVEELKKLNAMQDNNLRAGQTIVVAQ